MDAYLPYEIFNNHVSSVSHMVPGPHFENVEFEPWLVYEQPWIAEYAE